MVAGAGFGKSTLLASWAARAPSGWYALGPGDRVAGPLAEGLARALDLDLSLSPGGGPSDADAVATLLLDSIEETYDDDVLLLIDDVHELSASATSVPFLRSLVRQAPPLLHIVLASRAELPFAIERLRGRGEVLSIGAPQLRFSREEVLHLVERTLEEPATGVAAALFELTEGWPAAVTLALESLREAPPEERPRAVVGVGRPGGAVYAYLAEEVLRRERPGIRRLLELVAPLERFTPELCADLGVSNAQDMLDELIMRGLSRSAHQPQHRQDPRGQPHAQAQRPEPRRDRDVGVRNGPHQEVTAHIQPGCP